MSEEPELFCGDCCAPMILKSGQNGKKFFGCSRWPKCWGIHSAHQETGAPMGKPADAETRRARRHAHEIFDQLWLSGWKSRKAAYRWLETVMGLKKDDAHIGFFTKEQCEKLEEEVVMEVLKKIDTDLLSHDEAVLHIQAGLAWLTGTVQPDGAVLQHHGAHSSRRYKRFSIQLALETYGETKPPAFIFTLDEPTQWDAKGDFANAITKDEEEELISLVISAGAVEFTHWNGHGCNSLSVAIKGVTMHPTLKAALTRYRGGCKTHPTESVFRHCAEWNERFRKIVWPEGW